MGNYVIILAGGIGKRMGSEIPKQFIEIKGKPIIAYSIENFQRNPQIEKIVVVNVKDWSDRVKDIVAQYSLSKVKWIIEGGNTGHDSIRNGVFFLKDKICPDDFIIIHDSVRPILPQKAIDEVIRVAHEKGNASSSIACHPPIVYTEDFQSGITDIDREHVMLTASPQAYKYSLALKCYEKAEQENRHDFTFTSSLLIHCGERVYFAKGTSSNIKITTKEDLALFEALLRVPEELLYCVDRGRQS
ncbi:2-C-methyl-D-erythritol 4-phosphate cytidylyltransferase [uncultured Dysosmobacter sp.]|uniref:IspD/TarI family cytidylyltransferase n=1 Tax=uncultured Dysosmobacter sp. TaxID=2591384 RepID=UPI00260C2B61|nr:IspD/TarI family cytidylyltransferase [uncultured Dysosmobacter sp.]